MASSSRAKSSGVSSSSFFDLKAEISKKEDEFFRSKAAGQSRAIVGGVKRPDKKPTLWGRQNKGVKARAERDVELEAVSKPTLENARAALERKAALYAKLKKGKTGGLTDKQYESLLVDFDQPDLRSDDDESSEEDESATLPRPPEEVDDDPVVEYEDEFGRVRTARRSEVPRHLVRRPDEELADEDDDDPYVIRGDQGFFPVYEPSEERVKEIEQSVIDEKPNKHYDASQENRAAGAGFYQFSGDEETRRRQMEELKRTREETERARLDAGLPPDSGGELTSEGTSSLNPPPSTKITGRGIDKRKRDIEERRKAIEAKRRKTGGGSGSKETAADDFLARLEADLKPKT